MLTMFILLQDWNARFILYWHLFVTSESKFDKKGFILCANNYIYRIKKLVISYSFLFFVSNWYKSVLQTKNTCPEPCPAVELWGDVRFDSSSPGYFFAGLYFWCGFWGRHHIKSSHTKLTVFIILVVIYTVCNSIKKKYEDKWK